MAYYAVIVLLVLIMVLTIACLTMSIMSHYYLASNPALTKRYSFLSSVMAGISTVLLLVTLFIFVYYNHELNVQDCDKKIQEAVAQALHKISLYPHVVPPS